MSESEHQAGGAAGSSRKGAHTRTRILDLARQTLVQQGYDALVLRSLAADAGMTLGNLQYYFPTRECLLETVLRQEAETDLEDLRLLRAPGAGNADLVDAVVRRLLDKWRGDSGRVLALLGFLALHPGPFRTLYRQIYSRFYDELAVTLESVNPALDRAERLRRARLLTALLDGAAGQLNRRRSASLIRDVTEQARHIALAPPA